MFRHSSVLPVVVLTVSWLLGGCSLLNPHIAAPQAQENPSGPLAGGLDIAIRDANALSDAYYHAVGQQSTLRNGAALALLPLSGAALWVGITSAGPRAQDFLAAAGLGGATLFAGAQYFTDRDRQLVWLKGFEALGCAVRSMRAMMMPQSQLDLLNAQIQRLEQALAAAEQDLDLTDPPQAATLDRARSILQAARQWHDDITLSGEILEIRIRAIRNRVSEQIARAEPDLSAILTAAGSLRALAPAFAPSAGAPAFAARGSEFHAGSSVRLRLQELAAAEAPLAGALETAAALRRILSVQDDCLPADAAAAATLILPGGVARARGASADLPGRSSAIPRVAISGLGASDLSTTVLADGGVFVVRVTASATAAPGARTLVVMDQSGRQAEQVAITVIGTPGGGRRPHGTQLGPSTQEPALSGCAISAEALKPLGFRDCADFGRAVRMVGGDPAKLTGRTDSDFRTKVLAKKHDCGLPAEPGEWDWPPSLAGALRPDGTCRHSGGPNTGFPAGPPLPPVWRIQPVTPLRITNSAARNGSYGAAAAVVRLSDDPTTAYPLSASHVMAPLGARPGDPIRAAADCPPIRRCDVVARLVTWTGLVEDFGFPNVINAAIARLEPGLNPRFDLSDLVGFRFAQQHPAIGAAFRLPWAGVGSSGAVRDPGRDCVITWFDPHSPDPANPAELDYGMADLIVCDAMEHEGDSGAAVVDGVTGEVVGIVAGQPFPEPGEPVLSALSPIGAVATHPQWGGWRLEPWSSVPAVQPTAPGAWDPLTVLAKTLWAEAAIDRGLGMTAVAWVVMNRAKTGRLRWGRTPKDVCLMPSQFSCWNWGTSSRTKLEQCRRLIRACTPPRQSLQKRFPVFYPGPIRRWEPAFTMRLQPCRRHHPGRTATAPAAPSGGRYSLMTCNRGRKWRAARKPAASRLWY